MSTNAQHTPWKGPLAVSISGAIIDATGIPVVYATGFHHAEAAAIVRAINLSDALLAALKDLVAAVDALDAEEAGAGRNLFLSPGCVICTDGTTPNKWNTGPCAYHAARAAVAQAEGGKP
jgi:hypothetical protein